VLLLWLGSVLSHFVVNAVVVKVLIALVNLHWREGLQAQVVLVQWAHQVVLVWSLCMAGVVSIPIVSILSLVDGADRVSALS